MKFFRNLKQNNALCHNAIKFSTSQPLAMDSQPNCRTCTNVCGQIRIPLTSENSVILADLNFVLQGHLEPISDADTLSKWLCQSCLEKLTTTSNFMRDAIKSHNTLTNNATVANIKIEVDVEEALLQLKQELPDDEPIPSVAQSTDHEMSEPDQPDRWFCKYCDITPFFDETQLNQHLATSHADELPFCCDICNDKFREWPALRKHRKRHRERIQFCCHICDNPFKDEQLLRRHLKKHLDTRRYFCHFCGTSFSSKVYLMGHLQSHTKARNHRCKVCDQSFINLHNLKTHMTKHTGQRPFGCGTCGRAFRKKEGLTIHLRTHTGERPYRCNICNKSFTQRGSLHQHVTTMHASETGVCKDCGKTFSRENFIEHIRKEHIENETYPCSHCHKRYKSKSSLKQHMTTAHRIPRSEQVVVDEPPATEKGTQYPCSQCEESFDDGNHLIHHIKTVHGGCDLHVKSADSFELLSIIKVEEDDVIID